MRAEQQAAAAPHAEPREHASWLREHLEGIVVAVVLALLIRQYAIEAFVIPTGSMAPTLFGQHVDVRCPNCGFEQRVSAGVLERAPLAEDRANAAGSCARCGRRHRRQLPEDAFAAGTPSVVCACGERVPLQPLAAPVGTSRARARVPCTNCGYVFETLVDPRFWPAGDRERGDRILVNKMSYRLQEPARFDIAVFKYPLDPDENFIKRIVGLPGETLEVHAGDLYVDGAIARKPLAVQRSVWVLVQDSAYVEKDGGGERGPAWRPLAGSWTATPDRRGYRGAPAGPEEPGWLAYGRPIRDRTYYNGFVHAGGGELVRDVRVLAEVRSGGERPATVLIRLEAGAPDTFTVRVPLAGGRLEVERADTPFASAEVPAGGARRTIDVGRADARLLVLVDGRLILQAPFETTRDAPRASGLAVGVAAGEVVFERLRVYRDIHYLAGVEGHGNAFPFRVPPGHYFAMGDNAPNSTDGRVWGAIPAGHLIGRAFVVFWPALPWDFAVRRIR
ncbi:MAG: hypothetical protein KatS3mg102_2574 [Planctomycetota bacterium]|nr:MAG: hypothetical protein KatS3mg102_2574 [Planctomycetota bacterium]